MICYNLNGVKYEKIYLIIIMILLIFTGCSYNEKETELSSKNDREYIINQKIDVNKSIENSLGDIIRKFVNKDYINDDYTLIVSRSTNDEEEITKIYDLYFKLGGIRTNIGYTVFVKNNIVTSVYDNMGNVDIDKLKSSDKGEIVSSKVMSFTDDNKEAIREKVLSNKNINRKIINEEFMYNIYINKTYYITIYEDIDSGTNATSVDYYIEEL